MFLIFLEGLFCLVLDCVFGCCVCWIDFWFAWGVFPPGFEAVVCFVFVWFRLCFVFFVFLSLLCLFDLVAWDFVFVFFFVILFYFIGRFVLFGLFDFSIFA